MKSFGILLVAAALLTTACSSTSTVSVDKSESFRFLGREDDVRIDAQITSADLGPASNVSLIYEVHNLGSDSIVFVPLQPTVGYESGTRTITLGLGAEIPLHDALPQLVRIEPGQTRTFTAGARLSLPVSSTSRGRMEPRYLQVKFHYLDGTRGMEPWLHAAAPGLEDEETLFRKWVDHIAAIVTNTLPIHWGPGSAGSRLPSALDRAPAGF